MMNVSTIKSSAVQISLSTLFNAGSSVLLARHFQIFSTKEAIFIGGMYGALTSAGKAFSEKKGLVSAAHKTAAFLLSTGIIALYLFKFEPQLSSHAYTLIPTLSYFTPLIALNIIGQMVIFYLSRLTMNSIPKDTSSKDLNSEFSYQSLDPSTRFALHLQKEDVKFSESELSSDIIQSWSSNFIEHVKEKNYIFNAITLKRAFLMRQFSLGHLPPNNNSINDLPLLDKSVNQLSDRQFGWYLLLFCKFPERFSDYPQHIQDQFFERLCINDSFRNKPYFLFESKKKLLQLDFLDPVDFLNPFKEETSFFYRGFCISDNFYKSLSGKSKLVLLFYLYKGSFCWSYKIGRAFFSLAEDHSISKHVRSFLKSFLKSAESISITPEQIEWHANLCKLSKDLWPNYPLICQLNLILQAPSKFPDLHISPSECLQDVYKTFLKVHLFSFWIKYTKKEQEQVVKKCKILDFTFPSFHPENADDVDSLIPECLKEYHKNFENFLSQVNINEVETFDLLKKFCECFFREKLDPLISISLHAPFSPAKKYWLLIVFQPNSEHALLQEKTWNRLPFFFQYSIKKRVDLTHFQLKLPSSKDFEKIKQLSFSEQFNIIQLTNINDLPLKPPSPRELSRLTEEHLFKLYRILKENPSSWIYFDEKQLFAINNRFIKLSLKPFSLENTLENLSSHQRMYIYMNLGYYWSKMKKEEQSIWRILAYKCDNFILDDKTFAIDQWGNDKRFDSE